MKIAIYSTYNDGNGISNYTKDLFGNLAEVTIIPIDRSMAQHSNILRIRAIRKRYKRLAQRSSVYDLVHIQHEYSFFARDMSKGLFGDIFDYHRSFFNNLSGPYVITPHELPDAGARYQLATKESTAAKRILKQIYNFIFRTIQIDYFINDTIFSNAALVYVHTLRQKKVLNKRGVKSSLLPFAITSTSARVSPITSLSSLGSIGYIADRKGTMHAVTALAGLPSTMSLQVLGDVENVGGDVRNEYLNMINSFIYEHNLTNRIEITGYLADSEMLKRVKKLDLVLAPFREMNGSGSLAIAIAANIPILASDLPETRELVKLGAGVELLQSRDPMQIAEKVISLSKNPDRLNAMMRQSKLYAKKYSVANVQKQIIADYKKLVKNAK